VLVPTAISLGPLHGYGVPLRIQQISGDRLQIRLACCIPPSIGWSMRAGSPGIEARARKWNQLFKVANLILKLKPEEI
jgi:hypothetical protein